MQSPAKHIALFLLFLLIPAAQAADIAKGLDSLDRRDYPAAVKEFKPLAENGDARAQYQLGRLFALGLGVPRDYGQAVAWLKRAASQGNAHAQNDLGVLYDLGRGVVANEKESAQWFRKAAVQGIGAAQLGLASLYQEGRGVPQDPVEAFAWASAASQLGEQRAEKLVDATAKHLTPAQMQQAQKRADEYIQKFVFPYRGY